MECARQGLCDRMSQRLQARLMECVRQHQAHGLPQQLSRPHRQVLWILLLQTPNARQEAWPLLQVIGGLVLHPVAAAGRG